VETHIDTNETIVKGKKPGRLKIPLRDFSHLVIIVIVASGAKTSPNFGILDNEQ